jgi:hypothetical protein
MLKINVNVQKEYNFVLAIFDSARKHDSKSKSKRDLKKAHLLQMYINESKFTFQRNPLRFQLPVPAFRKFFKFIRKMFFWLRL